MRIDEILLQAIQLDSPPERQQYLDEQCGADNELRAQVESLLAAHEQAGSFLPESPESTRSSTWRSRLSEKAGSVIGRYKLLQEIGEGGFGMVFMAEQQEPVRRKVALKIIKPGMDSKEVIARFEAERQALAMMDHPNIARVLDGGTTDTGRPYFVMELVKGRSITEYCDANKLGVRERLQLHMAVCHAVQHAHGKGVIHRDLKPSNVMVTLHDGKPVVKVIDFGVSKALNQQLTERTMFTAYGQMVGTPRYMSPEQAEMSGLDVDTRSDVYSLGVLLYELLTGTTPLTDADLRSAAYADIQRMIREQEPPRPSTRISTAGAQLTIVAAHRSETPQRLHQLVRGELDWIAMKALEKDRTRRYETAAGLANDIERYLNDEPVRACPPSTSYRMWKFYRRNRGLVTAASLLAAMLLIGIAGTTTGWIQAMLVSQQLEEKASELAQQGEELRDQKDAALEGQQREHNLRQQSESQRAIAEAERNKAERSLYMAQMQLAYHALNRPHAGTVETTLERWMPEPGQPDHRGWEWYYLLAESRKDLVWTLHDHIRPVTNVAWSPDNVRFASVGDDGGARIWDVRTGRQIAQLPKAESSPCRLRWSPDGNTIATGHHDGTIRLWDGASYAAKGQLAGHKTSPFWVPSVTSIDFSANGLRLASYGWDQEVRIWDLSQLTLVTTIAAGEPIRDSLPKGRPDVPSQVALNPDGTRVAGISAYSCKIWDTASGTELLDLSRTLVNGVAVEWSPNGERLAVGTAAVEWEGHQNFIATVFDAGSGDRICRMSRHKDTITVVGWDAAATRLVTACDDNAIRTWNAEDGTLLQVLQGHNGPVRDASFSSDGRWLVSGGDDGTVRVWRVDGDSSTQRYVLKHPEGASLVAWSPDGMRLASASGDGVIRIWDSKTRTCLRTIDGHIDMASRMSWSPDGERLASTSADGTARVWDAETGDTVLTLDCEQGTMSDIAWSPDGRRLATTGTGKAITIWDVDTGARCDECSLPDDGVGGAVTWSRDGRRLAFSRGAHMQVFQVMPELRLIQETTAAGFPCVTFSPKDDEIASCQGHDVMLYDLSAGTSRCRLRGHTALVFDITWHPNGTRIATCSLDGTVRIWDVNLGQEIIALTEHSDMASPDAWTAVFSVAWSPDGQSLASASADGTVRIWDASKGYQLMQDPTFIAGQTVRQYQKAEELIQKGEYDRAAEFLTEVLKWRSEDATVFVTRARVYAKLGRWDRVKEDVERAWQLAPDTWNESYQAAFEGTGKDAIQPAIDLMTNRIQQEPGDEVAYVNRGDRHARLGRWDLAADDYGQATRLAPDNVWWWIFDTFPSLRIGNEQRYRADCEQILRFVRNSSDDEGLRGACAWVFTTRFRPIEDIPGVRELLQRRLDEVVAVAEPTEVQTAEQREVRIRLGLPTPELDKPMSSDPTAASANERLREALRAIQLGRVQEAQDLYDQAREMIKTLRMDDTGKDFWLLTRCEILAEEVGELLSHARK